MSNDSTARPSHVNVPGVYSAGNSHGVRFGPVIFWSGITARTPDGSVQAPGDAKAQASYCFAKLDEMLRFAGVTREAVLKLTIYTRNAADRAAVSQVKQAFFTPPRPASTGVVVVELSDPELLCEIEAISSALD